MKFLDASASTFHRLSARSWKRMLSWSGIWLAPSSGVKVSGQSRLQRRASMPFACHTNKWVKLTRCAFDSEYHRAHQRKYIVWLPIKMRSNMHDRLRRDGTVHSVSIHCNGSPPVPARAPCQTTGREAIAISRNCTQPIRSQRKQSSTVRRN